MVGCSLQEEEGGQALSFSQRSLLKVTVTRGRFSQSQCLGTLCLKGEGGKRAKRKKRSVFSGFPPFFFLKAYIIASWRSSGMDESRKPCQSNAGFCSVSPQGTRPPSPKTLEAKSL